MPLAESYGRSKLDEMYWLRSISFFILINFVLALPLASLLGAFLGRVGIAVAFAVMGFLTLSVLFLAEKITVRIYKGKLGKTHGLSRTLERAAQEGRDSQLSLYVFPDPLPDALCLRSLGSQGTILVSQGLLSILNEQELRAVLRRCMKKVSHPGIYFLSFYTVLSIIILKLAPRSWADLIFSGKPLTRLDEFKLSPGTGILFVILFPLIQMLLDLSRLPFPKSNSKRPDSFEEPYLTALQKISKSNRIFKMSQGLRSFSVFQHN